MTSETCANLSVGDKFIYKFQGTPFIYFIDKVGKETYKCGLSYIKKREIIKWTKEKQKIIDEIYKLQEKKMDLYGEIK